jgi:pimeloyl-ACP methyl ester carboxylesterase
MIIFFSRHFRRIAVIVSTLPALCALSCALRGPFHTHTYFHDPATRQNNVVVFLPGTGGSMDDLKNNWLLDTLLAAKPRIDVVTVNATIKYYVDRTLVPRLEREIVSAAKADGYSRIWFLGNSVGSLGALLYARKHPGEINGIILLGPYLGDESIVRQIDSAGGVLAWTPSDTISDNYQRDLWIYLKRCVTDTTGSYPRLFLIAGQDDRLHLSQQLLAAALKPENVFWAPGAHDWNAWRIGFGAFVHRHIPAIFKD